MRGSLYSIYYLLVNRPISNFVYKTKTIEIIFFFTRMFKIFNKGS